MKSLHFCTPLMVQHLLDPVILDMETIRTGWVPSCYKGDIIQAKWRKYEAPFNYSTPSHDEPLMLIEITGVTPMQFKELTHPNYQEEINRYQRKFHPEQWFFVIQFRKKKQKTLF